MLSQLNENWREDGVFERQRVYLQSVRGDVAWVIENNPNAATPIEQMTYDMWGVPGLLSHGADLDDDGDITNGLRPDGGVTIDDLTVFLELYEDGHAGADVDDGSGLGLKDGGVTVDDLVLYLAWFEGGATGSAALWDLPVSSRREGAKCRGSRRPRRVFHLAFFDAVVLALALDACDLLLPVVLLRVLGRGVYAVGVEGCVLAGLVLA